MLAAPPLPQIAFVGTLRAHCNGRCSSDVTVGGGRTSPSVREGAPWSMLHETTLLAAVLLMLFNTSQRITAHPMDTTVDSECVIASWKYVCRPWTCRWAPHFPQSIMPAHCARAQCTQVLEARLISNRWRVKCSHMAACVCHIERTACVCATLRHTAAALVQHG